jgi:hypothetical protein
MLSNLFRYSLSFACLLVLAPAVTLSQSMLDEQAAQLAQLALAGIEREYPNKPANVMASEKDVLSPKQMHPAFYGCFDWHSSVHGHWMLVKLLKSNPRHAGATFSREVLSRSLTVDNLIAEAKYFDHPENKSFERMYGWAWFLTLTAELHNWDDPQAKQWRVAVQPLETKIVELTKAYLPRLTYPIRTGVHPDVAFALGQIHDYATIVKNEELKKLIAQRAIDYYGEDRNYNTAYEPSGEDFFSPALNEADLMRRILSKEEFAKWLTSFLPDLKAGANCRLLTPVEVSDVTDGKLVHLAGLNLSRAWCMRGIASHLAENDPRKTLLESSYRDHLQAGMRYVFSGHYEGEHWLGTFVAYASL